MSFLHSYKNTLNYFCIHIFWTAVIYWRLCRYIYANVGLFEAETQWICRQISNFRRNVLPPSSELKWGPQISYRYISTHALSDLPDYLIIWTFLHWCRRNDQSHIMKLARDTGLIFWSILWRDLADMVTNLWFQRKHKFLYYLNDYKLLRNFDPWSQETLATLNTMYTKVRYVYGNPNRLHGVTTQKTVIFIIAAMTI